MAILCLLVWVGYYADVYLIASQLLPRDNLHHHFPIFLYVVRYFKHLGEVPDWFFTYDGGLWVEVLANNFLLLMPHHLLGMGVAALFKIHPNVAYKISLLLGQGLFLWGCDWALRVWLAPWKRILSLLFVAFSAVLLTAQHQEQILGTIFYLPWIWGAFLRVEQKPNYLFLMATLLGLSMNAHYPQFQVTYWVVIGIAGLTQLKRALGFLRRQDPKYLLLCGLAFFISASPLLRSMSFKNELESPYRWQRGGIQSESYGDYLEKNHGARWNVHPKNLLLYGNFFSGERENLEIQDDAVFHIPIALLVLLSLLFLKVRYRIFHWVTIGAFGVLILGTYGPMPKLLWNVFPAISMFRQWYHFTLLLDLHLMIAGLFVFEALWGEMQKRAISRRVLLSGGLLGIGILGYASPLYTIVPALLVILSCFAINIRGGAVGFFALIVAWFFVLEIGGAKKIAEGYREALMPYENIYYGAAEQMEPLSQLLGTYREQVVRIRGSENVFVRELAMKDLFYWWESNGKIAALSPLDYRYSFSKGKLQLEILQWPQNVSGLLFTQLFESGWRASIDGVQVTPQRGYLGLVLLNQTGRSISIYRKPSLWMYLICLMWLPLIGYWADLKQCLLGVVIIDKTTAEC